MKDTPIPETLGYFTPGKTVGDDVLLAGRWDCLPRDLECLFRASPKLADALAGLMWRFEDDDSDPNQPDTVAPDILVARHALADAGLEE